MKRSLPLLALCVCTVLCSCALLPRRKLEAFTYDAFPASVVISLGKVEVDHATMEDRIAKMLPEAITLAARKNGLTLATEAAAATVIMDVWVSEKSFTRELQTLNSVAFSVTLRDAEAVILRTIYTEETADTLVSFYHLYDVVDAVCRSIAGKLPRPAKTGA